MDRLPSIGMCMMMDFMRMRFPVLGIIFIIVRIFLILGAGGRLRIIIGDGMDYGTIAGMTLGITGIITILHIGAESMRQAVINR